MSQANAYLAYGDQDKQLAQDIASDQQALDALRLVTTSTRLRTDQLRRATIEAREQIEARERSSRRLCDASTRSSQDERSGGQQARYREIAPTNVRPGIVNQMASAQQRSRLTDRRTRPRCPAAPRAVPGRRAAHSGNGMFGWPTVGPSPRDTAARASPSSPQRFVPHFHDGIDIAERHRHPVRAADNGSSPSPATGADGALVVVMGHAGGYETVYAHLSSSSVRPGSSSKRGTRIGSMGCSGMCTGPHLHWEVWRNGATLNPRSVHSPAARRRGGRDLVDPAQRRLHGRRSRPEPRKEPDSMAPAEHR